MSERAAWEFAEGDEIHPGRVALRPLGGGGQYDVYLVWDQRLYALAVAKLLRPDRVEDKRARRDLAREAETLGALAHPTVVRGFDAADNRTTRGTTRDHDTHTRTRGGTNDTSGDNRSTVGTTRDNDTRSNTLFSATGTQTGTQTQTRTGRRS